MKRISLKGEWIDLDEISERDKVRIAAAWPSIEPLMDDDTMDKVRRELRQLNTPQVRRWEFLSRYLDYVPGREMIVG